MLRETARPPDNGLFGPGSAPWRLHREPALLIGGLRALMYQALHPLAIAAIVRHSDYKKDVWGRFSRTSNYVMTTIFGSTADAEDLGRRVREIHRTIRGVDEVTGLPYSADDPVLLLWVHTTLVESFLLSYRRFAGPLDIAEGDAYVAAMVRQAELVGLHRDDVPPTEAENAAFIDSCQPLLQVTRASRDALETVLRPPLPPHRRLGWWVAGRAAISLLPDRALHLYGIRKLPAVDAAVRPLVAGGSRLAARFLAPPPVLAAARAKAAAAGRTL